MSFYAIQGPVLIVDDHPVMRHGLSSMLKRFDPNWVLLEASDGQEAMNIIAKDKPAIVFMDIDIPKVNGLKVIEEINKGEAATKFVIYSNFVSERHYNKCIALRVSGVLLKECLWDEVLACIKSIQANKQYISPLCKKISAYSVEAYEPTMASTEKLMTLTQNEKRVLRFIAEKKTTKQIANLLYRSPKTIENIRYQICRKIGVNGHNSLLTFALENRAILD